MVDELAHPEDEQSPEEPWEWPDVALELFSNAEFLAFAERIADKYLGVLQERNAVEKNKAAAYARVTIHFLWHRFCLSVIAMLGLGAAAWFKLLPVEWIASLAAAVVGSLFVPPRRD